MFCYKCGKEIDDNAKFCLYCGAEVANTVSSVVEDTKETPNEGPVEICETNAASSDNSLAMYENQIAKCLKLAIMGTCFSFSFGVPGIFISKAGLNLVNDFLAKTNRHCVRSRIAKILSIVGFASGFFMTLVWLIYFIIMIIAIGQ